MTMRVLTAYQKENIFPHLLYELKMLLCLYDALAAEPAAEVQAKPDNETIVRRNALIESFAIHFRVVVDFFFVDERHKHDGNVFVEDFVSNWSSKGIRSLKDEVKDYHRLADVYVAHLSLARVGDPLAPKKLWDLKLMLCGIKKALQKFVDHCSKKGIPDPAGVSELIEINGRVQGICPDDPEPAPRPHLEISADEQQSDLPLKPTTGVNTVTPPSPILRTEPPRFHRFTNSPTLHP